MKRAKIYYKDYVSGANIFEGEAIILNKMDTCGSESFYEVKFIADNKIGCRWISNELITDTEA